MAINNTCIDTIDSASDTIVDLMRFIPDVGIILSHTPELLELEIMKRTVARFCLRMEIHW